MEKHNYADLPLQKIEHEAFINTVFEMNQKLELEGRTLLPDMIMFLKDWYIEHILGTDRNYIAFFGKEKVK